jgi:hypothetical protein
MTSLRDKNGDWLFITPIDGLELTKDVKEEFIVNRVIFVSRKKLPRIRKRLGFPTTISELTKVAFKQDKGVEKYLRDFFVSSKTYAILPYKGNPKDKEKDCIRLVGEELDILSFSQLGWSTRQFNRRLVIKTIDKGQYFRTIDVNKQKKELTYSLKKSVSPVPFIIDKNWVAFHKRFFFFDYLKLIRGKSNITRQWRTILHRVAILAGQSQNSNDLTFCFLWNVITLEMLLIKRGERISEKLSERAEYFLGWNEEWTKENYEQRIKEIYSKRCDFVHNGDVRLIEIKDLLFTDDLIFNILNNIIRFQGKINDFEKIVEFTEKYKAEKLLDQKSKYQFGKFEIMRKHYTPDDFQNI